jgi:hypothetical protein
VAGDHEKQQDAKPELIAARTIVALRSRGLRAVKLWVPVDFRGRRGLGKIAAASSRQRQNCKR